MTELVPGPLPPELRSLAFLLGVWVGEGTVSFPTMDDVRYGERMVFDHVGEPYLRYSQESWDAHDGTPLHFERGFVRPGERQGVELLLAHPVGVTEVAHGTLDGTSFEVSTEAAGGLVRSRTGQPVTQLVRRYRVESGAMTYELDMATEGVAATRHLVAELRRDP